MVRRYFRTPHAPFATYPTPLRQSQSPACLLTHRPIRPPTELIQIDYSSTRPNLPRDTYPLLNEHIRVLIYNGDWDACVPYTG